MNNIDLMKFWIESSNEDYDTMLYMKSGKKNTWCLFMGQMVIEKLLKALYAKKNVSEPYAPKSHDLMYLAQKINLTVTETQKLYLNEITRFNLNSRYDDYKREFSKKCTDEYTEEQINKIEEVKKWLENILKEENPSKESAKK